MKYLRLLALILLFGCANYQQFATNNRNRLLLIEPGMSKGEVIKIMGTESISSVGGATIGNPFKTESFKKPSGEDVLVLLYYTQINSENGSEEYLSRRYT